MNPDAWYGLLGLALKLCKPHVSVVNYRGWGEWLPTGDDFEAEFEWISDGIGSLLESADTFARSSCLVYPLMSVKRS